MLNRALAKLVLIAFWGVFFQCQSVSATTNNNPSYHSKIAHKSFCKKKITNGYSEVKTITVSRQDQQPLQPADPFTNYLFHYLLASLSTTASNSPFYVNPSKQWLTDLQRANPNKAPPISQSGSHVS